MGRPDPEPRFLSGRPHISNVRMATGLEACGVRRVRTPASGLWRVGCPDRDQASSAYALGGLSCDTCNYSCTFNASPVPHLSCRLLSVQASDASSSKLCTDQTDFADVSGHRRPDRMRPLSHSPSVSGRKHKAFRRPGCRFVRME